MQKLKILVIIMIVSMAVGAGLAPATALAGVDINKTISSNPGTDDYTSSSARFTGRFNVSVSGSSWSGTVTLQRSYDGSTWVDVATFTENIETVADEPGNNVYWRIGMKNGDYTSGTVTMRLHK